MGMTIVITSCSSTKKHATTLKNTKPIQTTSVSHNQNRHSADFINMVNKITEKYAGVSLSSLARSNVNITDMGYEWKFMNVRTGKYFMIQTNHKFQNITLYKIPSSQFTMN